MGAASRNSSNQARKSGAVLYPVFFRTDLELLAALQRGHPSAQAELYRRHVRRITALLHRVLGEDNELHDLVQETFFQALQSIKSFEGGPESFEAWLSRIAVYTARGHIRKKTMRRRFFIFGREQEAEAVPAVVASPTVVDALRRTYALLDKLPADERIPLALQLIDEMTLQEIAAACDVSPTTLKRRLSRAKARFAALAARDLVLSKWASGGGP